MKTWNFKYFYAWPLKQQFLVFGLLFLMVLVGGYFFDLKALNERLTELKVQETESKAQVESIVLKGKKLRKENSHLPALKETLTDWQKKLIKYEDLPALMNEILKIGANLHLYFITFNPEEEIKEGQYVKVPIKLTVVGNYRDFAEFMSQVANLPPTVVIKNFTMNSEAKNDVLGAKLAKLAVAQNLLTSDVTLEIYQHPEIKNEKPI